MTDRLMKLYELNEQYHDTKEKRAWLATTFYAGFSLVVVGLATNKDALVFLKAPQILILGFILVLVVIFGCVLRFSAFQYRMKRASVKIEGFISDQLSIHNGDDHDQLARIVDYTRYAKEYEEGKKLCWKQKKNLSPTERTIRVLMSALFSAQLFVILIVSGPWPLVVKWFTKCFAG